MRLVESNRRSEKSAVSVSTDSPADSGPSQPFSSSGEASGRNSPEHAELMKPGEIYPFTIEMYPTSLVFQKGHRIRLDISSSNFPRFDVNPNTGEAQLLRSTD